MRLEGGEGGVTGGKKNREAHLVFVVFGLEASFHPLFLFAAWIICYFVMRVVVINSTHASRYTHIVRWQINEYRTGCLIECLIERLKER